MGPFDIDPLRSQLQGIAQPQIQAPAIQMPQAPQPQPQMVSPYYGGRESVLSQEPQQDRMAQAFNSFIGSARTGNTPEARNQYAATQMFGGAASVLGGLMGAGSAQGGLDVLKHTQSLVRDAQAQRHQDFQDAVTGMRTMADIIGSTSPYSAKNAATHIGLSLKERDLQRKQENDAARHQNNATKNQISIYKAQLGHQSAQTGHTLRALGLIQQGDQFDAKLQMQEQLAAQANDLKERIAQLQADTQSRGQDMNRQTQIEKMKQQYDALLVTKRMNAEKFDAEMEAKLGQKFSNGEMQYDANTKIPSLLQSLESDISAVESTKQQPAASPSRPAIAPAKDITDIRSGFHAIAKSARLAPDTAKGLFIEAAMRKGGMTLEQAEQAYKGFVSGKK